MLERSEAVQDEGLRRRSLRTMDLVEEEAMAAKTVGLALECAVADAYFTSDLAKTGASDDPVEERLEEVCVPQPIGG